MTASTRPVLSRDLRARFLPGRIPRTAVLLLGFVALVLVALFLDSRVLAGRGIEGEPISDIIVPAYLAFLLAVLRPSDRLTVMLLVPATTAAEFFLSLFLRLYTYRLGMVPIYVPFGHAVLFGTTLVLSQASLVRRHENALRRTLLLFYADLLSTAVVVGDTFSLALAVPFLFVLWRSRVRIFYLFMGVVVLFAETTGVLLGCWAWSQSPLGVFHSVNPPLAVYTIYVVGDSLLFVIAQWTARSLRELGAKRLIPFRAVVLGWLGLV